VFARFALVAYKCPASTSICLDEIDIPLLRNLSTPSFIYDKNGKPEILKWPVTFPIFCPQSHNFSEN
jgi:hypothetical protein